MVTPQRAWKKDEVYGSVFAIRMVQAVVVGVMCGLGKMEGLYVFLTYVVHGGKGNVGTGVVWLNKDSLLDSNICICLAGSWD